MYPRLQKCLPFLQAYIGVSFHALHCNMNPWQMS